MLQSPQGGDAKAAASGGSQRSSATELTELLGKITQLMANTSLEKMLSQLNSFNAMMSGATSAWSEMAAMLEQQGIQWASDSDALKAVQQQADGLSSGVDAAQRRSSARRRSWTRSRIRPPGRIWCRTICKENRPDPDGGDQRAARAYDGYRSV